MKKGKRFQLLLSVLLIFTLFLAACGTSKDENQQGPDNDKQGAEPEKGAFKVAMVTDVGGVDDNSFNQSAWEGHKRLKEDLGYDVNYVQSTKDSEYQPNLNRLVRDGNELVWGIGFLMADDVADVAAENPDNHFGIVDHVYTDKDGNLAVPENVVSVDFAEHEGSFLVGLVAGHMTKSNKVGFLGGVKFALIEKFEYGFKAGVLAANPDVEILTNYAEAFDRPDLGQTFGAAMYDQGADIIYHASGQSGDGLFTEAKNRENVWVIGVDKDQAFLGEEVTLTSMIKRVDNAVYAISKQAAEGNFPGGTVQSFGLVDDGVGISESQQHLTQEILNIVEEYRQKIIDGEIKVPKTEDEYNEYLKGL